MFSFPFYRFLSRSKIFYGIFFWKRSIFFFFFCFVSWMIEGYFNYRWRSLEEGPRERRAFRWAGNNNNKKKGFWLDDCASGDVFLDLKRIRMELVYFRSLSVVGWKGWEGNNARERERGKVMMDGFSKGRMGMNE